MADNNSLDRIEMRLSALEAQITAMKTGETSMRNDINQIKSDDAVRAVITDLVEKRLDKIEKNTDWITKLILGGFVTAILALVINSGVIGIGP